MMFRSGDPRYYEKIFVLDTDTADWDGVYVMEPHAYLHPLSDGPFTEEELGKCAQIYYFVQEGFFPPEVDVEENDDGTFTIYLYEIVEIGDLAHTASSA